MKTMSDCTSPSPVFMPPSIPSHSAAMLMLSPELHITSAVFPLRNAVIHVLQRPFVRAHAEMEASDTRPVPRLADSKNSNLPFFGTQDPLPADMSAVVISCSSEAERSQSSVRDPRGGRRFNGRSRHEFLARIVRPTADVIIASCARCRGLGVGWRNHVLLYVRVPHWSTPSKVLRLKLAWVVTLTMIPKLGTRSSWPWLWICGQRFASLNINGTKCCQTSLWPTMSISFATCSHPINADVREDKLCTLIAQSCPTTASRFRSTEAPTTVGNMNSPSFGFSSFSLFYHDKTLIDFKSIVKRKARSLEYKTMALVEVVQTDEQSRQFPETARYPTAVTMESRFIPNMVPSRDNQGISITKLKAMNRCLA